MRRTRVTLLISVTLVLATLGWPSATASPMAIAVPPAPADATTMSSDALRTGWDADQPLLSPANVGASDFGQVFDTVVDGSVYAQPLAEANSIFVATERNVAYSIDRITGAITWSRSFGTPHSSSAIGCGDLQPDIGSTSTGVIDANTRTWYFTTKLAVGAADATWKLQAVSLDTGLDRPGFPVTIAGSATNDPGDVFGAKLQMQRPGLLLMDGVIYMAFGGHCDLKPYKGYVVGVSTATARITAFWSAAVGTGLSGSGIWQSGGALVSDAPGRIFLSTGNGFFGATPSGTPGLLGEAIVRLRVNPDGSLSTDDWFTPSDADVLDANDTDLGSGAPTALPDGFGTPDHPHLMLQHGKDGRLFVLDRDDLGGFRSGVGGGDRVVSTLSNMGGLWGHIAFFGGGPGYAYEAASGSPLRALAYGLDGQGVPRFAPAGASTGAFGYTSGSPVVTSNGTDPATALVWIVHSPDSSGVGAELRAYDALPSGGVLRLRWHAAIGIAAKFAQPLTYQGRVYVGTRDGHVRGFGRPQNSPLLTSTVEFGSSPVGVSVPSSTTVTATQPLTISAITTDAPFTVTPPTLPVSLTTGETLTLPVSYLPTSAVDSTALVTLTTTVGTFSAGVHGLGTADGLAAQPVTVNFGTQPTSLPRSRGVIIRNTGVTDTTITGVTLPSAPFTIDGAPLVGAVIPAGGTLTIGVSFETVTAGPYSDAFTLTSTTGTLTLPLSATAIVGTRQLVLSTTVLDLGSVAVGQVLRGTFTATNAGNLPLTITKAKAPSGAFFSLHQMPEGLVITEGTYTQWITFQPPSAGLFTATYEITADDGLGARTVTYIARGVAAPVPTAPAPPNGWLLSGSAAMSTTDLVLTPATANQTGGAVFGKPVTSDGLSVSFTTDIRGGATGSDGVALTLLDPAFDNAQSLGLGGQNLGFGSLHGVGVAVDTVAGPGAAPANSVGIAQTNGAALTYLRTAPMPTALRNTTHTFTVTYVGGVLSVVADGVLRVAHPVALPSAVLVGFTGATSAIGDRQVIRGVTVGRAPSRVIDTIAGTTGWRLNGSATSTATELTLTTATRNVVGSAVWPTAVSTSDLTASFTSTIGGGTGGGEGTTFALLDAATSTATSRGSGGAGLGFAGLRGVAVTLDTVRQAGEPSANFIGIANSTPAGTLRYLATAIVTPSLRTGTHTVVVRVTGGHMRVTLNGTQVLDAVVPIPPLALPAFTGSTSTATDRHSVSAITITAPRSIIATAPASAPWTRYGSAIASGTNVQLTPRTANSVGAVFNNGVVSSANLRIRYTTTIAPTTGGGEGMALALIDASTAPQNLVGNAGGALGYASLPGVAVASDLVAGPTDPGRDFIGVATGVQVAPAQLTWAATTTALSGLTAGTHFIDVWTADGRLYVAVDGVTRLSPIVTLPPYIRVGFTASTGTLTATHTVGPATIAA